VNRALVAAIMPGVLLLCSATTNACSSASDHDDTSVQVASDIPFVWSDAWLLTSITLAAPPDQEAPLKDVMAIGDAINLLVFDYDEISGGIARLQAAGLVTTSGKGVMATDKGRALVTQERRQVAFDTVNAVARELHAADSRTPAPTPDATWTIPSITLQDVNAAYDDYHREFSAEATRTAE
jgi:hypothetical protein